ncbi:MAG TPA: type II toxin-antitoxin system VapC family toxin, partial [Longimicrobium sp.]
MGFVLDTNLYVAANRNREQAKSLSAFYKKHLRATHLHAVVVQEILAGAKNREDARATHGFFIDPFERVDRIIVPTYNTWKRVGEIIWRLAERKLISRPTLAPSFVHDVMLAASCRQLGHTLVTANVRDFELIR